MTEDRGRMTNPRLLRLNTKSSMTGELGCTPELPRKLMIILRKLKMLLSWSLASSDRSHRVHQNCLLRKKVPIKTKKRREVNQETKKEREASLKINEEVDQEIEDDQDQEGGLALDLNVTDREVEDEVKVEEDPTEARVEAEEADPEVDGEAEPSLEIGETGKITETPNHL